ncbi:unnamed protein product [Clonostachys chloroleuca]|uniref:Uncharacterized protein n=1 Tax=Clonostachys chloroleuca TaxID=1926264 RepID=A0AA35LTQ9_9HYPO|nr:unnamed protein product [Clonostachys chloroleuca]
MHVSPGLSAVLGLAAIASAKPTNYSATSVQINWIGDTPGYFPGASFGVPWSEGALYPNSTTFSLSGSGGNSSLQSWITGYWRDGSIKWSGHAIPATDSVPDSFTINASPKGVSKRSVPQKRALSVEESGDGITVDTGKISVTFPKAGSVLVSSIETAGGNVVGTNGKLVLSSQSALANDVESRFNTSVNYFNFESNIEEVSVSQDTSVRALVTTRGQFRVSAGGEHNDWLPFVVRFYLYSNSNSIRIVHSIVFNGDGKKDFISGLGIRFQVPLEGEELYNRHVRISGSDGGFLTEAVKGITGLRRDPGTAVKVAQYEGKSTPDISTWDTRVSSRMHWIPAWNDYSLRQLTSDGFQIKKRTKAGQSWLDVSTGPRSDGLAYLGGSTTGGLAVGLRNFWKQFPTGLDISNAATDNGEITLWLYSPEAGPLDLRPYHDGLGQDTYAKQLDALEITYEDYEPGFDTPTGIAKTHEIFLHAFDATPSSDHLGLLSKHLDEPPALVAKSDHIQQTRALGSYWSAPHTSKSQAATIEKNLEFIIEYYKGQIEGRRWYGFLHYGDFMHTYDVERHVWRYDIGGYAWDNSELSPDLFFWLYFLRTGRADVYRFAEALTRHTGEVDVYHTGDWKGLGTRHGVLHFADSAKQARIAQPQYRKYFYFLTGGDERVGELLEETLDADKTYGILDAHRKVRTDGWKPSPGEPVSISLGTDWAALAAGWLIEWERRGSRWQEAKEKLTNTAAGIAKLKNGFVTGEGLYDIEKKSISSPPTDPDNAGVVDISHLSAVFGEPEVLSEAIEYWGDDAPEGLAQAWLDYCYFYGASGVEQKARYGSSFSGVSLKQGHARLSAYYYQQTGNSTLAARTWNEFFNTDGLKADRAWGVTTKLNGSAVLLPGVEEVSWISTNDIAQYGLSAIQGLALASEGLAS